MSVRDFLERMIGSRNRRASLATTALICLGVTAAIASAGSGGAAAASNSSSDQWRAQNTSQSQQSLIVVRDIVVSGDTPLASGQAPCAITSQFYHGQKAVFRVKVIDPDTGKPMNSSRLDGVTIHISTGRGTTLHAKDMGEFWVAPWTIPNSFPAGRVDYSISVTGRNARTVDFPVQASQMTVRNESISDLRSDQSGTSSHPTSSDDTGSLPIVWLVVGAGVIVVVAGLIWNAKRR